MEPASLESTVQTLSARIRKARLAKGMTQEQLAGPEFTKGYVSALERGAVRPSLKALDVFSKRLGLSLSYFVAAPQEASLEPDLTAVEEDLNYQMTYAKMLIRTGQVEQALETIAEAERNIAPFENKLEGNVRYLVPFARARAYLQRCQPNLARPELEAALKLARSDAEASARVRNLLGVAHYEQEQPQLALHHHLECLQAIHEGEVKDISLQLSIYRNLANDYWALRDVTQAIGIYKEALGLFEDFADMERQAGVYWGLAVAYKEAGDSRHAKLYAARALHIYDAADNQAEAASICMNLAQIGMEEGRYEEAEQLLERAKGYVVGTGARGIVSLLYRDYAELARRRGNLAEAEQHAAESIKLARAFLDGADTSKEEPSSQPWLDPMRTYAEALHAGALVAELQGNTREADHLFEQALTRIKKTTFEESIRGISYSYAEALKARGEYEKAMEYYRSAAQSYPRPVRNGVC